MGQEWCRCPHGLQRGAIAAHRVAAPTALAAAGDRHKDRTRPLRGTPIDHYSEIIILSIC